MSTTPIVRIFPSKQKLAEKLAADFVQYLMSMAPLEVKVYVALSGGSTPSVFFKEVVKLNPAINWENVIFFWVDERCVPPGHPESNFGVANREFLSPLGIPESSYHRIIGENDPEKEAKRYGDLVLDTVSPGMSFPVFHWVFLGMGADGHTASIFPNQINLWNTESLCTVGIHPETGQKRISFTGHLINAATRVAFLVTGKEKQAVVESIIHSTGNYRDYPASLVSPNQGELEWYLDADAAGNLSPENYSSKPS